MKAVKPGVTVHPTLGVDGERFGAGAADEVERVGEAAQQHGLGEHLGHPGLAGDDGREREVGVGRPPGAGVDEVVAGLAVHRPSGGAASSRSRPRRRAGRGSRSARWRHGCSTATVHASPARAGVAAATRRSPPEVDADAGRAGGDDLVDDEVGGEALADAAGVEAGAGRQPHAVGRRSRCRCNRSTGARPGPRCGRELVERAVVAGADDVAEHGRVEAAAGQAPRLDRRARRAGRSRPRRRRGRPGAAVELVDLAVSTKRLQRCSSSSMRRRAELGEPASGRADDDHVARRCPSPGTRSSAVMAGSSVTRSILSGCLGVD